MAGDLEFDAAGSNIDGTNPGTALAIWANATYAVTEHSWPAPPVAPLWASSIDTEGSALASVKHENRALSLTVEVLSAAGLRSLEAKVGKLIREGGTLKWTLPNSEAVIFDVLTVDQFEPAFDVAYYVNSGAFCQVRMAFTAKPYGRGSLTTLSASSAATIGQPLVFTKTGIKGDVPALGSLRIANATNQKSWGVWGIQSRYYSSASSAALFFEAENGFGAVPNAGPAGASGGGANKVARVTDVGIASDVAQFTLSTDGTSGGSNLSHIGAFRAFARVQAPATNTGTVSVRLAWSPRLNNPSVPNDSVAIVDSSGTPIEGAWVIVDLGPVTIRKSRAGTQAWKAQLGAWSTVATDDIDWDWVAFVPVSEGYGLARTDATTNLSSAGSFDWSHDAVQAIDSASNYYDVNYTGDYLLVPPAGAEARTLRIFAMLAGANPGTVTDTLVSATNLDAITATLTYTPRYLIVPEP